MQTTGANHAERGMMARTGSSDTQVRRDGGGPNERLRLPTFWRGVETCIWLLAELTGGVEHEP